eukprot:TRINITY_DN34044_c0_g1_i1.p1 TRINITY_DN34044_c0_g1~~TRINITY_DN34044_c0_g1_i1.p1  ORF type:complete len:1224 (+),score=226.34 TRINITY_DN34044_c0_g1_i1:41-3712(+)
MVLWVLVVVCGQIFPSAPVGLAEPPRVDFFDVPTKTELPIVWNTPAHARFINEPGNTITNEFHMAHVVLGDPITVGIEIYDEWGTVVMDPFLEGTATAISSEGALGNNVVPYTPFGFLFTELRYTAHPYFAGPYPTHDHILDEIVFRFDFKENTRLNGMLLHARTVYVYPRQGHKIQFSLTNPPVWPTLLRGPGYVAFPEVRVELVDSLGALTTGLVGVIIEATVVAEETTPQGAQVSVRAGTGKLVVQDGYATFRNIIVDFTTPKGSVTTTRLQFNVSQHNLTASAMPPLRTPGFDLFNYQNPSHFSISLSSHSKAAFVSGAVFSFNDTLPKLDVALLNPSGTVNTTIENLAVTMYPFPLNTTFEGLASRQMPLVDGVASFDGLRITTHGMMYLTFKLDLLRLPSVLPLPLDQETVTSEFSINPVGEYSLRVDRGMFPVNGVVLGHPIPLINVTVLRSDGAVDTESTATMTAESDSGLLADACRVEQAVSGVATFNDLSYTTLPTKRPNDTDDTPPIPIITFTAPLRRGVVRSIQTVVQFTNLFTTPQQLLTYATCTIPTPTGVSPHVWIPTDGGDVIGTVPMDGCISGVRDCLKSELVTYDSTTTVNTDVFLAETFQEIFYINDSSHVHVRPLSNSHQYVLQPANDTGWIRMWAWCRGLQVPTCVMFPFVLGNATLPWFRESPPFDVPLMMRNFTVPLIGKYDNGNLSVIPFELTLSDVLKRRWKEWELIEWVCKRAASLQFDNADRGAVPVAEQDAALRGDYKRCTTSDMQLTAVITAPEGTLSNNAVPVVDGVAAFNSFHAVGWRGVFDVEFQLESNGWVLGTTEMRRSWSQRAPVQWTRGFGSESPVVFVVPWEAQSMQITIEDDRIVNTIPPAKTPMEESLSFWHIQTSPISWTTDAIKVFLVALTVSTSITLDPALAALPLELSALATAESTETNPNPLLSEDLGAAMRWVLSPSQDADDALLITCVFCGVMLIGAFGSIFIKRKERGKTERRVEGIFVRMVVVMVLPVLTTSLRHVWSSKERDGGVVGAVVVAVLSTLLGMGSILINGREKINQGYKEGIVPAYALRITAGVTLGVFGTMNEQRPLPCVFLVVFKSIDVLWAAVFLHKTTVQNVFTLLNAVMQILVAVGLLISSSAKSLLFVSSLLSLLVIIINVFAAAFFALQSIRPTSSSESSESDSTEDSTIIITTIEKPTTPHTPAREVSTAPLNPPPGTE